MKNNANANALVNLSNLYYKKINQSITFKRLVSQISIKRYSQEEYVDVINAIYEGVYEKKTN